MYKRHLQLNKLLKSDISLFLFGARGVGKTLLVNEFLKTQTHSISIDLLQTATYRRLITSPELFKAEIEAAIPPRGNLTVFIDEIQKLPTLLDDIHSLIENHKKKLRFILTGSSARKLKRGGANLLAGRALSAKLYPFSFIEMDIDIYRALQFGTLPAIYLDKKMPFRRLAAYVDTYLREEIFEEALVRKVENFVRFLDIAAQFNGEPVNYSKIGRAAGISGPAVEQCFSILIDTLIASRIDGWSYSVKKQLTLAPKYYFFDCGVLNALRGELKTQLKKETFRFGKLFETYVINELIRMNDYCEESYKFYHWRTNSGLEVDIIMTRGFSDEPWGIEIKSEATPGKPDFKALLAFKEDNPKAKLICLCQAERKYKVGEIEVYPWQQGIRRIFT